MEDIHPSQDADAPSEPFDPFAAQPLEADHDAGEPPIPEDVPIAETVSETEEANIGGMPLPVSDYGEAQHRIQLSDQVHVDIPDETLGDAQAHLWKNGFPNMNKTDTIAALLRSGVVTQGVPVEGVSAFYREHGVIPNAQAADALRSYFQGATPQPSLPPKSADAPAHRDADAPFDPFAAVANERSQTAKLRDQHELDRENPPDTGDLMRVLQSPSPRTPGTTSSEDARREETEDPAEAAESASTDQPSGQRPLRQPLVADTTGIAGGGRGFALPSFGLRSFIRSRAEHSRERRAANVENVRLDMAMEAARTALQGVDPYLPGSGLPEADRAMVYADRMGKDPEARHAHYEMIGKFSRLRDTVEQWTDAAKDNPALQKEADKKLKAVDDLLKSGEVVPDTTFKESLDKIAKAISEMFSRIFQKFGLSTGKSAKARMGVS